MSARDLAGSGGVALIQSVADARDAPRQQFLQTLDWINSRGFGAVAHLLVDLAFTSVFETLFTGSLIRVPRDEQILPEIREVLGEHAREEAFLLQCYPVQSECVHRALRPRCGRAEWRGWTNP